MTTPPTNSLSRLPSELRGKVYDKLERNNVASVRTVNKNAKAQTRSAMLKFSKEKAINVIMETIIDILQDFCLRIKMFGRQVLIQYANDHYYELTIYLPDRMIAVENRNGRLEPGQYSIPLKYWRMLIQDILDNLAIKRIEKKLWGNNPFVIPAPVVYKNLSSTLKKVLTRVDAIAERLKTMSLVDLRGFLDNQGPTIEEHIDYHVRPNTEEIFEELMPQLRELFPWVVVEDVMDDVHHNNIQNNNVNNNNVDMNINNIQGGQRKTKSK